MPRKNKVKYLLLPMLLLLLCGCAQRGNEVISDASPRPFEAQEYDFIFVCPIIQNEYWEACIEGIKKADQELGTRTQIIGPQTADNFAVEIVGYMAEAVAAKPDGIMVYAGIEDLGPLIDEATGQGIPVLALDSDAPNSSRVAYIGTNSYNAGYVAGETMVELTGGTAKLGLLVSSLSADKEMEVLRAFLDAVDDYDFEVVAMAEVDADPDVSEAKTREMLAEHPEITAIFNTVGYGVTGAARVKKEQGLNDLVLLGFDDVEENLKYVREGIIDAIFVQRIYQIGYQGVYLMKECVDKGALAEASYDTGTVLVTRENVDSYAEAGLTSDSAGKTVRVGYYSGVSSFQDGFDDEVRKSGYAYEYYQAIATLTGWSYEYVYGSRSEVLDMLLSGDVDIMAGIYQTDIREGQVLFSRKDMGLDGEARFFAVNKERIDLLTELDYAMEQIIQSTPDFAIALRQKYYSQSATQQMLTERESMWLADQKELRIGYVRYNLPISDQGEDGRPTGMVKDLTELLTDYLRVTLEPVCYENVTEMEEALRNGEIDAAFPVYSDLWRSEIKGFRQTDSFISDRVMVVYQGSYSSDLMARVALSQTGLGQRYYLDLYYPDSEVVFFDSREDAFEAIRRGDERCIVGCSSILQRFLMEHSEYQDMNIAYLDTSEDFGMAVSQNNSLLAGILNKAIRQLDAATVTSALMSYSSVDTSYTFKDFVQKYSVLFIGVLSFFFAVLTLTFVSYRRKTKLFNKEQAKTRAALEDAVQVANAASQAKTTFLSSMSHDIRTPMNAIVGMTVIASKHLEDRERVKDCLDKISLSSHHLLTLINDVLDISKIESGKLVLNPVVFSLKDTVTALVNIIRPQLKAKNLQFDVHVHGMEYESVYADEVRVNQIFINILTNAVKYTPEGGWVVMDVREEVLTDGNTVRIIYEVEDSGIGMSEGFMENMYELFSRAEDSRINKIQGTGLGLAIVKQMVDMMGGTIDCTSVEDEGTKFTVTLDLPIAEKDVERQSLPQIRALLVDDDEIFLETAGETLRDMGLLAETANSGAAAVEMVKARHEKGEDYPIFIVDWKMPDMDGVATIKAIRDAMGREAPVILVSAYDWTDIEEEATASGVNGFVSKPLFRTGIYEKLSEVLRLSEELRVEEAEPENDLKGRHLLIAEDNDLNWEVIAELLAMYGITADWAKDGQSCVDMLTAAEPGTYDMILMDIQMPIMNGRDATRVIRKDQREYVRTIPIIAMTADAFAEDIAACLEAGMDGHVAKPVDMDKLFQEMRKALG